MKTFFSTGVPLITLSGLLLLPVGWAQAGTTRVSVDSVGNQANSASSGGSISADGRLVVFNSDASNLVAGDTNGYNDIFVHDRQTRTTTRVSVDSTGRQANGVSWFASISAEGRFVTFVSFANNLVANDTNDQNDIFVHDRQTGTTTRVSVGSAGNQANAYSGSPFLSADGRFVVFSSAASNLVAGDTNDWEDVFVHDRQTSTTTRVNVDSAGNQAEGPFSGSFPSISADGRFVAFASGANNLVAGDTNGLYQTDIFVHDRQTGATTRVNVDSTGGEADAASYAPSISADGRFVIFESEANNLVPGDENWIDVFVHDRQTGTTTQVSVNSAGQPGNFHSYGSSISADGRFAAFGSYAKNLGPIGYTGIFVHDRQTGTTTLVSANTAGKPANGITTSLSSISADGHSVAFTSDATNLVAGDSNGHYDIFVHQSCNQDADCDTTPDFQDNCLYVPNGPAPPHIGDQSQRDTNGDGFGNLCDADLNNDGLVTTTDYLILRSRFNTADADADLNGDGLVTTTDYQILRGLLHLVPGPSGLVP